MSNRRKIVFIISFIVILGLFWALGSQIYGSLRSGDRLNQKTEVLVSLQKKNMELKNRLNEVQSIGFIEEEARNKLGLAREGETVFIIPQKFLDKVLKQDVKAIEPQIPNWQGWLKLFWK